MPLQEKQLGQKFIVDAIIYCDVSKAGQTDALEDTINYAAVYRYSHLQVYFHAT